MKPVGFVRTLLARRPTGPLRYCDSRSLLSELAQRIAQASDESATGGLTDNELRNLIGIDYRLLAVALFAQGNVPADHAPIVDELLRCSDRSEYARIEWQLANALVSERSGVAPPRSHIDVDSVARIENSDEPALLLHDETYRGQFECLIDSYGGRPGEFIESRLDLPGRNAVHRNGSVKSWCLPDGTEVISKRENARKPGNLMREVTNIEEVLTRFGARTRACATLRPGDSVVTIDRPLAILADPASSLLYAVWLKRDGATLEEILLADHSPDHRTRHLRDYRSCLDLMFDRGIVWRDMSPRNIIVKERLPGFSYQLVDFEKVEFHDRPLTREERVSACRSQFCVEEFGVICPPDELMRTFAGLFDPGEWNTESRDATSFPPRPELTSVLEARGVKHINLGTFNRMDREFLRIRCPQVDPATGELVRPGLLGFRVEHYLSLSDSIDCGDYDRKTSEVLLATLPTNCTLDAVDYLSPFIDRLENAIVLAEFDAILASGSSRSMRYPTTEASELTAAIDELMSLADNPEGLRSVVCGRRRAACR